jgi:soluble lytic murein transglycosylase-like protein
MAQGGFWGGLSGGLPLGIQLGLRGVEQARQDELLQIQQQREERLAQMQDRQQGLNMLQGLGNIFKAQVSPALKKVWINHYLTQAGQLTGQPIDQTIVDAMGKATDDDRQMMLDAMTEIFGADASFGAAKLADLGMDFNAMATTIGKGIELKQQREEREMEQRWLQSAQTGETPPAQTSMVPSSAWQADIEREATAQGIDPRLVASVMRVESGGNPQAVSPAGAQGLMQIMPETGRELGLTPGPQAFDPKANIKAGVTYLGQMLQRFGGDVEKALTAYHSGPGNAEAGTLGPEGRAYASRVMGVYKAMGGPDLMGVNNQIASIQRQIDVLNQAPPTARIEKRLNNLQQERDRLMQQRQFAITESRQQQQEARQERESILNPEVEAARVRIAQAEGQAKADVALENLRYTPVQQEKLNALNEGLSIIDELEEFPPEAIDRWAGYLRLPAKQASQAFSSDPEFQRWDAINVRLRNSQLFSRTEGGGAALTPTEASNLLQAIATGRELGGGPHYRVKLQAVKDVLSRKVQTTENLARAKPGQAGAILQEQRRQEREERQRFKALNSAMEAEEDSIRKALGQ